MLVLFQAGWAGRQSVIAAFHDWRSLALTTFQGLRALFRFISTHCHACHQSCDSVSALLKVDGSRPGSGIILALQYKKNRQAVASAEELSQVVE